MADRALATIRDEDGTSRLAVSLAPHLRPGSALLLDGPLGAGKTTFVRSLARALDSGEPVVSPTFTYENRYSLAGGGFLLHVDLYRLDGKVEDDLLSSIQEGRAEGGIVAVEWGSAWREWLTPCLELSIAITGPVRRFELRSHPVGWKHLAALEQAWRSISTEAQP